MISENFDSDTVNIPDDIVSRNRLKKSAEDFNLPEEPEDLTMSEGDNKTYQEEENEESVEIEEKYETEYMNEIENAIEIEEENSVNEESQSELSPPSMSDFIKEPKEEDDDTDFALLTQSSVFEMVDRSESAEIENVVKEESDEDQAIVDEEEELPFDYQYYYNFYDELKKKYYDEKQKNNFYHRRVAEYYKKRKMHHVLQEGRVSMDMLKKYGLLLDELAELSEFYGEEKLRILKETGDLTNLHSEKQKEVVILFKNFQNSELELGKELENGEPEKKGSIIERYLRRQKIQLSHIIKMRLDFIRLKTRFNEKQVTLDALDNLGPDLHLIDYEQLKLDNRNLVDKLEAKEEEITKIRKKCQNAVQILAHVREKVSAIDTNINYLGERLGNIAEEAEEVREESNELKQKRDSFRNAVVEMKDKSGLLTKPKLLRDYQNAKEEVKFLAKKLKNIKVNCSRTSETVNRMREVMNSTKKLEKLKMKISQGEEQSESSDSSEFQFNFKFHKDPNL